MWRNRFSLSIVFFLIGLHGVSQNILDFQHTIKFADYLYHKGNYNHAIVEFNRAWLTDTLSTTSQIELFQSYLKSGKFAEGAELYKSKYPSLLAQNDSLELVCGKLFLSSKSFKEVQFLIENSKSLTEEQSFFLSISSDLLRENWNQALSHQSRCSDWPDFNSYHQLLNEISKCKYKNPVLSLSMSAVVPGLGKAYSGYWKEGLTSFTLIAITAFQAYRGFSKYGSKPYSWIYASLSASFYVSNLFGSYKAANRRNYDQKQKIRYDIENAYNQMYNF